MTKLKTITATAVLALTGLALVAGPASAEAAKFGSKVNKTVQPSNAGEAHPCPVGDYLSEPAKPCTWVMGEAYGNPGGEGSPKKGKLRKLKLVAGEKGSFRLQIARVKPNGKAKVVRNGPRIRYQGQPTDGDPETYRVERFKVKVPIKAGERLAIKTKKTSTLRCSSGGPNTLLFHPPLVPGSPFASPTDDDGCWLLLQGIVR